MHFDVSTGREILKKLFHDARVAVDLFMAQPDEGTRQSKTLKIGIALGALHMAKSMNVVSDLEYETFLSEYEDLGIARRTRVV